MRVFSAMAIVLVAVGAQAVDAQSTLRVRVLDKATSRPLPEATVYLRLPNQAVREAITDSAGVARLTDLSAGIHVVGAAAYGFLPEGPLEIKIGADTAEMTLKLTASPVKLPSVEAAVAAHGFNRGLILNGFHERKKHNRGIFMNEAEIENRKSRRVSDLLRTMPGIQVRPTPGGQQAVWFTGSEGFAAGGMKLCGPKVFLDGFEVSTGGGGITGATPIDGLVPATDLAGIEVYRRPSQIPTQYGGATSACGVILLWTR